ncbi:MAG: carboxypeptidase-like regulatory domain-containing protein, partial [Cyclobacteriaceae bacterium]
MQKLNIERFNSVATKSKIGYLLIVFLFPFLVSAQSGSEQIRVEGKVLDKETGEGLFGATIQIKGGYDGMLADYDGNFSLLVPGEESILVVGFVGYTSQEVLVGDKRDFVIKLETNL